GGRDRPVHIGLARLRDPGQGLLGRRVDRAEVLPAQRRGELPTDEQAVLTVDGNDVARFGCGRVLPVRAGPEGPARFPGRDRRGWIAAHLPLASTCSCDANLPRPRWRAPARQGVPRFPAPGNGYRASRIRLPL